MPTAMIAPMKLWMLSEVPVRRSMRIDPEGPRHGGGLEYGDLGKARLRRAAGHDREVAHGIEALHAVLRDLHLDLKGVAAGRIAPVVGRSEARAGGGGDDRADHVGHGEP